MSSVFTFLCKERFYFYVDLDYKNSSIFWSLLQQILTLGNAYLPIAMHWLHPSHLKCSFAPAPFFQDA